MKKISLLSILFISLTCFATVRTVSNVPATIAQFNTIQAAIDASSSGDTIYIHGSPNVYTAFTITNKQLVLIGPGWAPNKNLPHLATIPGATITGAASANTELQGLTFTSAVNINSNKPNDLRFIRNHFTTFANISMGQGSTTYSGYLFEGNIFANMSINATGSSNYQNFIFQNNVFFQNCCISSQINGFTNSTNILFNHNLFYGPSGVAQDIFGNNSQFLLLTNNIFVKRNAANQNSTSTFNGNITFNAGNNTPWASNGNVNSGGNVDNQDPQMVDQVAVNAGSNNFLINYTIPAGPANNTASDGKDMGLLFDLVGSLNWTNSRGSRLPFIFSMSITNPTISAGSNLNVVVEARKNN